MNTTATTTIPSTSPHRRRAIALWITSALMVVAALSSLLYALYSGTRAQWPAVLWQLCQLFAILSFGLGLWSAYKHRHWHRQQSGEPDSPWD